jgi:nitrous oxide reductase accessory protein NosL
MTKQEIPSLREVRGNEEESMRKTITQAVFWSVIGMLLAAGAAFAAPREIPKDTRCPVCGMFADRDAKWQAQLIMKDGKQVAAVSPKHLFMALHDLPKHSKGKYTRQDVDEIWVRDYDTGKWIDATRAHFVAGSKVTGPMGPDIVAFMDHAKSLAFKKEQGGVKLHYPDITAKVIDDLEKGTLATGEHKNH